MMARKEASGACGFLMTSKVFGAPAPSSSPIKQPGIPF